MAYKLNHFDKILAKALAVDARKIYNFELSSNIEILKEFRNRKNFTIVYMPFSDKIDGFSCRRKNHYIIVLNSKNNINRQNFTCAHELYHLLYEYEDDIFKPSIKSEELADIFASYFLIPEDALIKFLTDSGIANKRKLELQDIVSIENYFQVSRQAMLNRLRDFGMITAQEQEKFSYNVINSVRRLGGNVSNYTEPINPKIEVVGEMKQLIENLFSLNKISVSKYEEYLYDMFEDQDMEEF